MVITWLVRTALMWLCVVGLSMCGVMREHEGRISLRRHRRSIDATQIEQIVTFHNTLRQQEGASNIAALSWDADLAGQASCTATSGALSVPATDSDSLISDLNTTFTQQKDAYNHTQLTCSIDSCNIYLQVVWASATKVGCITTTCQGVENHVCMYDVSVEPGVAPYMTGTPCADCPTDLSQCTESLCSAATTTTTTPITATTATTTTPTTTITATPTTTPTTTVIPTTTTSITSIATTTTEPTITADPATVGVTTAEGMTDETTSEGMTDETTAEGMTDETTAEGMTDETTAEGMTDETTAEGVTDETTTEGMTDETTAEGVTDETTTEGMTDETTTEGMTDETTDESTTTAETTGPTDPPENPQTIADPDAGVYVLLSSPLVVFDKDKKARVEKTLKEESARILNQYCCQYPADCCGVPAVGDVNITDCESKDFISDSGIRLGEDSPVDRTVDDVDVLVYQLVAVTHTDNAICMQVKQAQAARSKRAIDDDEMLVPRNVFYAALETSVADLSESLSDLGVEVSVELNLPENDSEAPMFPVWGWALVGVGALIVLSQFVIIAMVCMRKRASKYEDNASSDSASRYDSKMQLFAKQNQQKRDSGQSGNSGSSNLESADGVGALRFSSKMPWGNGHQGGNELRAPIRNYPMDGNGGAYVPRAQRQQREPQYVPDTGRDTGYPWAMPDNRNRRNWGGESSVGDGIGQGIFPQSYR